MEQIYDYDLASWQLYLYNVVLLSVYLYLMAFKYVGKQVQGYIVCLFFYGMFHDFSVLLTGGRTITNIYQIVMLTWGLILVSRIRLSESIAQQKITFVLFVIYGLYFFFTSMILHTDNAMLTLAQFSKLLIPLCFLLVMKEVAFQGEIESLFWTFWELVCLQIVFSLFKMILIGGFLEGWVGSLTGINGGGMGTSLPLLGLILFALKTDLKIKSLQDVVFLIGLLLIGFATGKRAVWILFPVLFFLLGIYAYKRNIANKIIIIALAVPLMLYAGLRLTPTLNPERKVGGSFDPEYALSYGLKYSAGIDNGHQDVQSGVGRIGALNWMWQRLEKMDKSTLFGLGLEYIIYADHEDYSNQSYYQGIQSRGSITGIVNMFMTIGLIGVTLFILFVFALFLQNRSRIGRILLVVALFDFVFYNATILTTSPLLSLTLFLSLLSEEEDKKERMEEAICPSL